MAARARYYDGKVALAREVTLRPASHELIILDAASSSVLARWPAIARPRRCRQRR